jgi:L,D-transpeptidase YbiS
MIKWIIAGFTLVVLGGVGYLVYRPLPSEESPWEAINDSLQSSLPSDPAAAKKELARVQKALQALQPKGRYIVVDTQSNHLSYRTIDSVFFRGTCSTGSGGELIDSVTNRKWVFNTPHGVFKVQSKLKDPWWRKPDWHYIEEKEDIPKDPKERFDAEVLGDFALGFGDGYFIHGTLYKRLLGISVTHGCVRLGDDDLKALYDQVPIGTPIYIF